MAMLLLSRAGPSRLPHFFASASVGRFGIGQSEPAGGAFTQVRTATKRGGGSTKNVRSSAGRRLGLKKSGGQPVRPGEIIVRQRGQKFHPGQDVYIGKDHTLHAGIPGFVKFYTDPTGESVGYKAVLSRKQRTRKFVGVTRTRDEKLPRDESKLGRARYFPLVDVAALERAKVASPLEPTISASDLVQRRRSSDAIGIHSPVESLAQGIAGLKLTLSLPHDGGSSSRP